MSAKKLSDKKIKNIIAERAEGASYNSLAKKYKISVNTVKKYCMTDPEFAQKCKQKKEENEKSVLDHMETKAEEVCGLLDALLVELSSPERIKESSTRDIATVFGILVDKFDRLHDRRKEEADTNVTVTFAEEAEEYAD